MMEKKVTGITRGGKEIWKVDRKDAFAVLDITQEGKGLLSVAKKDVLGQITPVSMQLEDYELKSLKWSLRTLETSHVSTSLLNVTIIWSNGKESTNRMSLKDVIDFLLLTSPRRIRRLEICCHS